MKRSRERILTTHAGSLPRPADLLDLVEGTPEQADARAARVRRAVADVVRWQVELGLDVIDDGEMSKPSFVTYVNERLGGFEPSTDPPVAEPQDGPGLGPRRSRRAVRGGAECTISC